MLLRFDPFRELDRVTESALGRPSSSMPMDAVRRGETVVVSFDLPGVDPASIDVTVERNVLDVRTSRDAERAEGDEVLASERRSGPISRQLLLGDSLDGHGVVADYDRGVLTLYIPVTAAAKPRKIEIGRGRGGEAIDAEAVSQN
jgi:HSP20 family protein